MTDLYNNYPDIKTDEDTRKYLLKTWAEISPTMADKYLQFIELLDTKRFWDASTLLIPEGCTLEDLSPPNNVNLDYMLRKGDVTVVFTTLTGVPAVTLAMACKSIHDTLKNVEGSNT